MVDQLLTQNSTFVEDIHFNFKFNFHQFFNLHIVISNSFYNILYIVKMLCRRDVYEYFM